jgi:glucose/arabinose dehydrogenase
MTPLALFLVIGVQQLPEPFHTPWSRIIPSVVERPAGAELSVPPGFEVEIFAEGLRGARLMALAPNGDVFVTLGRSGEVVVLRDENSDGIADRRESFATDLNRPFGIAFHDDYLYIANNDAVVRFTYTTGQLHATEPAEHLIDLPPSGPGVDEDTAMRLGIDVSRTRGYDHWTRNLSVHPDGSRIYVAMGSVTNATPGDDPRRAAISEYRIDGSGHRIFASGMRNPVGMDFYPGTGAMWATVQERDHLGDDLVPDFVTSVQDGGFYGWPYAYIGPNPEPILEGARPDLVEATIAPEVLLTSHSAAMDISFYTGDQFPEEYQNSAFVGLHGSINRSSLVGYSVVSIPFSDGQPVGEAEDFLTGFIVRDDPEVKEVWGRPVDVLQWSDGSVLISDDGGGRIFRVWYRGL